MDFSSIISHPDKEEIISKILNGTDPKDVNQWLRLKYQDKNQKHLHISIKILQDFAKSNFTNYYDQFNKDLTVLKDGGKLDKRLADSLMNNKTYHERISEYADKKIDIEMLYANAIKIVMDRAIQIFDKIQENPAGTKADYVLIKWFEQLFGALEKYDKHKNTSTDQVINHNYTVQYIDQTNAIYQEAFREVLAEIDPALCSRVMNRLAEKLTALHPPIDKKPISIDEELAEVKFLSSSIKEGRSDE